MTTHICCNCHRLIVGASHHNGGVHWHPYSCVNATTQETSASSITDPLDMLTNPANPFHNIVSPTFDSTPDYSTPPDYSSPSTPDTSSFDFGGGGDFSGGGGGSDF